MQYTVSEPRRFFGERHGITHGSNRFSREKNECADASKDITVTQITPQQYMDTLEQYFPAFDIGLGGFLL